MDTVNIDFALMNFKISDPAETEIGAGRNERFVQPLRTAQADHPDSLVFNSLNLNDWIQEAQAAGIPSVGCEVACRIPVDTILNFEEPREQDHAHWLGLKAIRAGLAPEEMLRWDCCAGLDMKMVMEGGGQDLPHPWMKQADPVNSAVPAWRSALSADDPRFFDIAYTYPGEDIAVIKRPWVEARREDSHPVEYRVFVQNGEVLGVANYYVQRPMALNDQVHAEVVEAIALTDQLLASMQARHSFPFNGPAEQDNGFTFGTVSCTLDFLVDSEGKMLFLEAGPPFGLGAHPCAFMKNEAVTTDGRQELSVRGVALDADQAPLAMGEFIQEARKSPAKRKSVFHGK